MKVLRQIEAFAYRVAAFFADDDHYRQHAQMVDDRIEALHRRGKTSREIHGITGADGITRWSPRRLAQQKQLINDLWAASNHVPNNGEAVMMGGLGGAGKGTIRSDPRLGLGDSNYMRIDPDQIKEQMASRGMIPQVEGLSPMEASPLVHHEAGDIADRLAQRAYAQKRNVLWDIAMSSHGVTNDHINSLRKSGYNKIDGVFVDVDPKVARIRAESRHRHGEETFRSGRGGMGGRWLPNSVSARNLPTPGSGFKSHNAEVFAQNRHMFDNTAAFDGSTRIPGITTTTGPRWQQQPDANPVDDTITKTGTYRCPL